MSRSESLTQDVLDATDRCEFCDGCRKTSSLCDSVVCDWCGEIFDGDDRAKVTTPDGSDELVCEQCLENEAERAHDAATARYYGGDGPQTIAEQQEAARRLK